MTRWDASGADQVRQRLLSTYQVDPDLAREHARAEVDVANDYSGRQVLELFQNARDALLEQSGRVEVFVDGDVLLFANEGAGVSEEGLAALTHAHLSPKVGDMEVGRFGLGFKSLTAAADRIDVISGSLAVRFDRQMALAAVREVVPDVDVVAMLRAPFPVPEEETGELIRSGVLEWASTTVRMFLSPGSREPIVHAVRSLPAEVLLFSPQVTTLRRVVDGVATTTRLVAAGDRMCLESDGTVTEWLIAHSDVALPGGGTRANDGRDHVDLTWALPSRGADPGELWAFLPIGVQAPVPGILNSFWDVSQDRATVQGGSEHNKALATAAGELIVRVLAGRRNVTDPGATLDLLPPAPGKHVIALSVAERITKAVHQRATTAPLVPDLDGVPRIGTEMRVGPDVPSTAFMLWEQAVPTAERARWAHRSVAANPQRRDRATELGTAAADAEQWLSVLMIEPSVRSSVAALQTVSALLDSADPLLLAQLRTARVVLAGDGTTLLRLDPNQVHLSTDPADPPEQVVHPDVHADPLALDTLLKMGVREFGTTQRLVRLGETGAWKAFWRLANEASTAEFRAAVAQLRPIRPHVRTASGTWRPANEVLLIGPVVDQVTCPESAVDKDAHRPQHLAELGVAAEPTRNGCPDDDIVLHEYQEDRRHRYFADLNAARRKPSDKKVTVPRLDRRAGPLRFLKALETDEARARYTERLLAAEPSPPGVTVRYERDYYPPAEEPGPEVWAFRRYGILRTSLGLKPAALAVSGGLREYKHLLPVADVQDTTAAAYGIPTAWKELTRLQDHIDDLFAAHPERVPALCVEAARHDLARPDHLPGLAPDGTWATHPAADVRVTVDADLSRLLYPSVPIMPIGSRSDADRLATRWALAADLERSSALTVHLEPTGEVTPLTDFLPWLAAVDTDLEALEISWCDRVERIATRDDGTLVPQELDAVRDGDTIAVSIHAQDPDQAVVDALRLNAAHAAAAAAARTAFENDARRHELTELPTDAARLAHLIPLERLRELLPATVREALADADGEQLARALAALHGTRVLDAAQEPLRRSLPDTPFQWAGGTAARSFTTRYGFDEALAGAADGRREPSVAVWGPSKLPPLHPYQEELVELIHDALGSPDPRGCVYLPTGAGKTRTVVEALIRRARSGLIHWPLVWIAQSDELCEQAVDAWTRVWRSEGPPEKLTVSRLWGQNRVLPADHGHVVVASIQKLERDRTQALHPWLDEPGLVVVDEAHRSITTTYTQTLTWLGARKGSTPLLGLTATPRRSSDGETTRLVRRYGDRLIEATCLSPDPFSALRDLRVLAEADHQVLDGIKIELNDAELKYLGTFEDIPESVARVLSDNPDRNRTVLDAIRRHLPGPVLVFAANVEHAELLAALLAADDIAAMAISGRTPRSARRDAVERLRAGELQVVTNYNVLTEGFDAPGVTALVIARPTYSWNRYMQMLGRGLRGPLNGGTERCTVIDVKDNIARWHGTDAFEQFRDYWTSPAERPAPDPSAR